MPDTNLPQEPTWKLLGVSDDMMDIQFCNKLFPFRWRSSLAISAFEPKPEVLPESLCEGRITFLKITATITGYQPSREETEAGYASFPNVPVEELSRVIDQYFACYGAILNVAVFPSPEETNLNEFPHIIDVEPKTRDLIQAGTESGEILTSSKSNVKTNKSLTHTESSETGWKGTTGYNQGKEGGFIAAELSHKDTETEQENWSVTTDASRERQEKEGSTMQISQMYNLLSSYHIGTNRVQFLMLPRPHTKQPTDNRTFIQGLREIEGIQEFILIVARPNNMKELYVEALLETGHFPEGLIVEQPEEQFEEKDEVFRVIKYGDTAFRHGDWVHIDSTHTVESGWVVDTRRERGHDPDHPGMQEIANDSNAQANSSLKEYNYQRIGDAEVQVSGIIRGGGWFGDAASFDRTYRVFTRSTLPKPITGGSTVSMDRLLVTSRSLCLGFKSGPDCPERLLISMPPSSKVESRIVAELPISISHAALTRGAANNSIMPAIRELLTQIRRALTTSWRLPKRRPLEEAVGFLDSDYFKDKIKKLLPRDHLMRTIANVPYIGQDVITRLGESCTVAEALEMDLVQFSERTGLKIDDAAIARRSLLGIRQDKD